MTQQTLLCIDDEAIGLHVRKLLLESHGYRVLTAESGLEGLAIFRSQPVNAVVLDYYMPAMHGGQVAAAMKELKPEVPIVFLSAYLDLPESDLRIVDAFVTKGQSPEILLKTIAELLAQRRH